MAELSTLARPYAKAAFEYAAAKGELQGWSDSLGVVAAVAQQSEVEKLLSSPNYTADQQAKQLIEICGDALNEQGRNFIGVLAENRRLKLLPAIQQQFEVLKANREKSIDVDVVAGIHGTTSLWQCLDRCRYSQIIQASSPVCWRTLSSRTGR